MRENEKSAPGGEKGFSVTSSLGTLLTGGFTKPSCND